LMLGGQSGGYALDNVVTCACWLAFPAIWEGGTVIDHCLCIPVKITGTYSSRCEEVCHRYKINSAGKEDLPVMIFRIQLPDWYKNKSKMNWLKDEPLCCFEWAVTRGSNSVWNLSHPWRYTCHRDTFVYCF
jgi:hypothetical protein